MTRRILPAAIAATCVLSAPAWGAQSFPPPLFTLGRPAPQPPLLFVYHGWRIDARPARKAQAPAKTVRAVMAQLDIVEHVGFKPATLDVLRAVPITVVGGKAGPSSRYIPARGVWVRAGGLGPKKAVVLHALLHAYQDKLIPGGGANPQIVGFYKLARASHDWPNDAEMLQDPREFFAATATVYLYGDFTREPYSRSSLHQTQPGYYQWLADQFDAGRQRPWKTR